MPFLSAPTIRENFAEMGCFPISPKSLADDKQYLSQGHCEVSHMNFAEGTIAKTDERHNCEFVAAEISCSKRLLGGRGETQVAGLGARLSALIMLM